MPILDLKYKMTLQSITYSEMNKRYRIPNKRNFNEFGKVGGFYITTINDTIDIKNLMVIEARDTAQC